MPKKQRGLVFLPALNGRFLTLFWMQNSSISTQIESIMIFKELETNKTGYTREASLPLGGLVTDFIFTNDQKTELLCCMFPQQNKEDIAKGVAFLERIEPIITLFNHCYFLDPRDPRDGYSRRQKEAIKKVLDTSKRLKNSLIAAGFAEGSDLECEMLYLWQQTSTSRQETLFSTFTKEQKRRVKPVITNHNKLKTYLAAIDQNTWAEVEYEALCLRVFSAMDDDSLYLFKEAMAACANKKQDTGLATKPMQLLVHSLAVAYEEVFGTAPATRQGSIFMRFCALLSVVIGVRIGRITARTVRSRRQPTVQPSCNSRIFRMGRPV